MPSVNKTEKIQLNQWQGNEHPKRIDFNDDNLKIDNKFKEIDTELSDLTYKVATGTATAITLTIPTLVNGYAKTFIASANNNGSATTINGKPLYKPNTTTAPNLTGGKAYTIWYDSIKNCFFIKASAEGNTIASHVLAGDTFSNDNDTGLIGTMVNNGAITITPSTVNQAIPTGYHNGNGYVVGDSDLISANIKAGANIFNVQGKASVVDTADATALLASQIVNGYTAYANGNKIAGNVTIESLGGKRSVNGIASFIYIPGGEKMYLRDYSQNIIYSYQQYFIDITGFDFIPKVAIVHHITAEGYRFSNVYLDDEVHSQGNGVFKKSDNSSSIIATYGRLRIPIGGTNPPFDSTDIFKYYIAS